MAQPPPPPPPPPTISATTSSVLSSSSDTTSPRPYLVPSVLSSLREICGISWCARVIPLIYNEPRKILYEKLNLVNGMLFTGGWAKSGLYFEVVESNFENVLSKNVAGDHFPLLAICLGFELLTMTVSQDNNVLEKFNAADQASTLQFMS